jgi:hypothetical protein
MPDILTDERRKSRQEFRISFKRVTSAISAFFAVNLLPGAPTIPSIQQVLLHEKYR